MNNDMGKIFSKVEIDEIETFREGTEAMSINGEEIVCFSILSDIVQGRVQISELSRVVLLKTYKQLKESNEICSDLVWLNSSLLEQITPKAKKIIMAEFKKRKGS